MKTHFPRLELRYFHRVQVDNATFFGVEVADDFTEVKFVKLPPGPTVAFKAISEVSTAEYDLVGFRLPCLDP